MGVVGAEVHLHVVVVASRVAVESGRGDHLELEGRLLQVVRVAAVADEVVGGFPLIDDNFLCVPEEGVLRVVCGGVPGVGDDGGTDVGAVHAQEAPVVAAPDDGGFGHGVGPSVVPDDEHVLVSCIGLGAPNCKPLSLYPEIVSIVVTGLDDRGDPNHPICDIDHTALQLKF